MNFLHFLLWASLFIALARCQTTVMPEDATEEPFRPEQQRVPPNSLEQPIEEAKVEPVIGKIGEAQQAMVHSSVSTPLNPLNIQPRVAPFNPTVPVTGPAHLPQTVLASMQRQIPPHFGNPFRPSIIRNQGSSFIALPPKDQPVFDSFLCLQQRQQESNLKRDLGKRSLHMRHLDQFYLNSKNQDVLFSVCGELMPAHRIVLESISSKFGDKISALNEKSNQELIEINHIDELLAPVVDAEDNSTRSPLFSSKCPNGEFAKAFRIFLKFFYAGGDAFNEIDSLDVGFLVWKLGADLLDMDTVQQLIEPQLGNLISLDNLPTVYRFMKHYQIASLNRRWSEFITVNARTLTESGLFPLACEQIAGDIEYLDRFIEALNVNQSLAITFIRNYLRTCPESANFSVKDHSPLPFSRSLQLYRCSISDLKELLKMGFISYENLAEELETRLRAKERHCEEKCSVKFVPMAKPPGYRQVGTFNSATFH